MTMQPLKAHVRNGRLVLDEPTDRPEGDVIELVPLDEVLARGGDCCGVDASGTSVLTPMPTRAPSSAVTWP